MKFFYMLTCALFISGVAVAQTFSCDLRDYHDVDGLKAEVGDDSVELNWEGEARQQLRAQFTLRDGGPLVRELAARMIGGQWIVLGKDLRPDFEVTTGSRPISSTEMDILKQQHKDTPDAGNFFGTTGEILFLQLGHRGLGCEECVYGEY